MTTTLPWQLVTAGSRKAARRSGRASGILTAPVLGISPGVLNLLRGQEDRVDADTSHATVIHGATPQETWTAGNSLSNQCELLRHRGRALRLRGTEDADNGQSRRRSHMHGSGIIADKNRANGK